ncbi:hypothetical protein WA577_006821 [Blastocystis sp. JDR]
MDDLLEECHSLVVSYLSDNRLVDFWEPVKWQELGLFDYLEIIKNPMDLTTVKVDNKCETKQYQDVFDFAYDMRLIWRNCIAYNQDGCVVVDIAKRYQKLFEERFSRILSQCVNKLPSVQTAAKRQLVKDIAKLNIEELGLTVQMVWEICPDAVSQTKETIEVEADKLSKYCYYVVKSYISSLSTQTSV